LQMISDYFTV